MYILGLSIFGQNPAACILKSGKLVAFAEEERFIRLKSAYGFFPTKSISFCLKKAKINLSQVEKIAVSWDANKYYYKMPIFFGLSWLKYGWRGSNSSFGTILRELIDQNPKTVIQKITLALKKISSGEEIPPIKFVSHHLSHAASTFFASGFKDAAILIMDGSGEERATTIYYGFDKTITEMSHVNIPNSLGWFYAAMTAYLGFVPYQQDGYLMGLAPYGTKKQKIYKKFNNLIQLKEDGYYEVNPEFTMLGKHSINEHFSDKLIELFGPPRYSRDKITQRHKDIAFATQDLLEKAALGLVRNATKNGKVKNLCLAGGVALNCKMNGVILRSKFADRMFVQPVSNDAGAALGAAMVASLENGYDPRFTMKHALWGINFSNNEVEKVLKEAGVGYKKIETIEKKAAEFIAEGKVVGWFQGRMEIGPRALGARSILANPRKINMKDHINNKVKHRDPWRPFCPSLNIEVCDSYFDCGSEAKYMIVAYQIKNVARKKIPSVIHVDGSSRPQVVDAKTQPLYHSLINEVGKLTGSQVVLNTSFNVRGEPIVCTPQDALRCFFSTGIDALAIENFWVEKSK